MDCIIFVMMEESCTISARKPKSRLAIRRLLRCMDVQTTVVVNTKPDAFINIMRKNKVMKNNEQWETLREEAHTNIQGEKVTGIS